MKILSHPFILTLILISAFVVSCTDDEIYTAPSVPDGMTELAVSVNFPSFTPALQSRAGGAPGNAIKEIKSLWVVIYEQGADNSWKLEEGGKIQITAGAHNLKTEIITNQRPDGKPQAETETGHASFRLTHPNGLYKMYAVANYDMTSVSNSDIDTPEKLKALVLTWDPSDVQNNAEMFGCFANDNSTGAPDETLTIDTGHTAHAWIRRAASKLTIAFDTRGLKDNISIYIKSVTVKDIPRQCPLANDNKPEAKSQLCDGDILYFGNAAKSTDDYTQWRVLTKATGVWGYRSEMENAPALSQTPTEDEAELRYEWEHAEASDALYFYENMQGKGKNKAQTAAGPGNESGYGIGFPNPVEGDNASGWKDNMPYGSYVEVEGYYVSKIEGDLNRGKIKYRFMLGKDIIDDYNAERNHHYKLTLVFRGKANDYDWHIDYKRQVLNVSRPEVFNYQGKVFVPNTAVENLDHNFIAYNPITVASYEGPNGTPESPCSFTVRYRGEGATGNVDEDGFYDSCSWLSYDINQAESTDFDKKLHFKADTAYVELDIDATLKSVKHESSDESPINLADIDNPTSTSIVNTANCYMIDGPGYYMFPLVYGNAITNSSDNKAAYKRDVSSDATTSSDPDYLESFHNHLGHGITSPYIRQNAGCNTHTLAASLVWQDEAKLITDIKYKPDAYGENIGGIQFYINPSTIKQGNGTIALKEIISPDSSRVMWSWHIWATCLDVQDYDKDIDIFTPHYAGKYSLLPVNLGWCSAHNAKIRYHKKRTCQVKIISGDLWDTITFVQESHIAFPLGNNPYYQWGRKDPFVGADQEKGNKTTYKIDGSVLSTTNPKRFYHDFHKKDPNNPKDTDYVLPGLFGEKRDSSYKVLYKMIEYPDVWFNPPQEETGKTDIPYNSINQSYRNLWETISGEKTIYDPCPVGYYVSRLGTFSGFTTVGWSTFTSTQWLNVLDKNIADGNPKSADGLYEFYTSKAKVRSIVFPKSGYRDWNDIANVLTFKTKGYIWQASAPNTNNSFYLEFSHISGTALCPDLSFYNTDGFPIRPTRY